MQHDGATLRVVGPRLPRAVGYTQPRDVTYRKNKELVFNSINVGTDHTCQLNIYLHYLNGHLSATVCVD